jgi:hypothetical protein
MKGRTETGAQYARRLRSGRLGRLEAAMKHAVDLLDAD